MKMMHISTYVTVKSSTYGTPGTTPQTRMYPMHSICLVTDLYLIKFKPPLSMHYHTQ